MTEETIEEQIETYISIRESYCETMDELTSPDDKRGCAISIENCDNLIKDLRKQQEIKDATEEKVERDA